MNIWIELLTALVRAIVQVVVGVLVAHGIVTAEQAGHFTTELTMSIVAAAILFIATFGASIWNKIKARNRFITALQLSPGISPARAVEIADSKPLAVKIQTATSPGNVPLP